MESTIVATGMAIGAAVVIGAALVRAVVLHRQDRRPTVGVVVLAVLLAGCAARVPARDPYAGLSRCTTPDGRTVYRDVPCDLAEGVARAASARAVADPPGCIRRTPHGSLWQRVQVLRPGVTETNTLVVRNRDSCACPVQCFRATTGLHAPPVPWAMCSLSLNGRWFRFDRPTAFCLAPGDEWRATVSTKLAEWSARDCAIWTAHDVRRAEWSGIDRTLDYMEIEGDALCGPDTTTAACAGLVYERAPER